MPPSPLSTPQTAAAGISPPSEPPPLELGLGGALNPELLCRPVGMAVCPGRGATSGLVHFGGALGPAKGQGLTLEVLGQPPQPPP